MTTMYVFPEEEKKRSVEGLNELIREVKDKLATDPDNAAEVEEALRINPKAHDTWELLGTVFIFYVSLNLAKDEGQIYLQKAIEYFQEALNNDPGNETYLCGLESATRKLAAYSKEAVGKVPVNEHPPKSLKTPTQDPGKKRNSESLEAAAQDLENKGNKHDPKSLGALTQCTGNGHYPEPLKNSIQWTAGYFKKAAGIDPGNGCYLKFSEPPIQKSKIFGNGPYGKYVWTLSVAVVAGVGLSRLSFKNV